MLTNCLNVTRAEAFCENVSAGSPSTQRRMRMKYEVHRGGIVRLSAAP